MHNVSMPFQIKEQYVVSDSGLNSSAIQLTFSPSTANQLLDVH